jgi:predicted nucleic acid-binding Zn ribbon protein
MKLVSLGWPGGGDEVDEACNSEKCREILVANCEMKRPLRNPRRIKMHFKGVS